MYKQNRPVRRPAIYLFIIASLIFTACATTVASTNWPGLSTSEDTVYVSYGTNVVAYDVAEQQQTWIFPSEPSAAPIYAAPSIGDDQIVIGDFGAAGGFFSPASVVTLQAVSKDASGTPASIWLDNSTITASILASPLHVGDQLFVATTDNHLYAFTADSGQLEWEFIASNSIWGQPTFHEGNIYITTVDNKVYAINAENGELAWNEPAELGGSILAKAIIDNDLLYVGSLDAELHALSVTSGEEIWSFDAQDWVWNAPAVDGSNLYFSTRNGTIFAVDAQTGEEIWSRALNFEVYSSPLVVGDAVIIASAGDIEAEQGKLFSLDKVDGRQLWEQNTPAPLYTTPVYVADTIVVALQAETALLIGFEANGNQAFTFAPPEQ